MSDQQHSLPTSEVELRPAYTWTCDSCGRDQYGTLYIITEEVGVGTPNELKHYGPIIDIEMWPVVVSCPSCEASFYVGDIY